MQKVYHVVLTAAERTQLQTLITQGTAAARALTRARILLKADESPDGPAWTDTRIIAALDVSRPTVARVRQRFVTERLAAVARHPPSTRPAPKVDGEQEAHLIALACGPPPQGRGRWSLRLLAERYVVLGYGETISHEWVRQTLKKTASNRG
jgi:Homeodomain-like domain